MVRERTPNGTWGRIKVTRLPDGKYEAFARYRRVDGEEGKAKRRRPTSAAAERALKEALAKLVQGAGSGGGGQSQMFEQVAEAYLEEARLLGQLRHATLRENERLYRSQLLPRFGRYSIEEISPVLVADAYREMVAKHAPQARNAKGVLNKIMDFAVRMEFVTRNPVASVKSVKRKATEIFAPDADELEILRDAIDKYENRPGRSGPPPSFLLRDVIELILGTSGRIGEVLGLRWAEDVDLTSEIPAVEFNGSVKEGDGLPKRWEPTLKTEASKRRVQVDPIVAGILMRRYLDNNYGHEYVFSTASGKPNGPQDVHRALRNVRRYAGLPDDWVPRVLRQTVATEVANALGIEEAASTLGHKRSRVTEQSYAKRPSQTPDIRAITIGLHGSGRTE